MALNGLGWLALLAARHALRPTTTLTWEELQSWIADMSNPDSFGRRYGLQKFQARRPDGHVEIRRETLRGDKIRISAALMIGPKNQTVSSKSWEVDSIDPKLQKKFGDNLRFSVKV